MINSTSLYEQCKRRGAGFVTVVEGPWLAVKKVGEWLDSQCGLYSRLVRTTLSNIFLPFHYVGTVGIEQAEAD